MFHPIINPQLVIDQRTFMFHSPIQFFVLVSFCYFKFLAWLESVACFFNYYAEIEICASINIFLSYYFPHGMLMTPCVLLLLLLLVVWGFDPLCLDDDDDDDHAPPPRKHCLHLWPGLGFLLSLLLLLLFSGNFIRSQWGAVGREGCWVKGPPHRDRHAKCAAWLRQLEN